MRRPETTTQRAIASDRETNPLGVRNARAVLPISVDARSIGGIRCRFRLQKPKALKALQLGTDSTQVPQRVVRSEAMRVRLRATVIAGCAPVADLRRGTWNSRLRPLPPPGSLPLFSQTTIPAFQPIMNLPFSPFLRVRTSGAPFAPMPERSSHAFQPTQSLSMYGFLVSSLYLHIK